MKLWLWKNFVNGKPEYWADVPEEEVIRRIAASRPAKEDQ